MENLVRKRQKKRNTKTERIVAEIRQQIVDGVLNPGEKLPTYDFYEKAYSVSRATMQMVFRQLKSDGFVESAERERIDDDVKKTPSCRALYRIPPR